MPGLVLVKKSANRPRKLLTASFHVQGRISTLFQGIKNSVRFISLVFTNSRWILPAAPSPVSGFDTFNFQIFDGNIQWRPHTKSDKSPRSSTSTRLPVSILFYKLRGSRLSFKGQGHEAFVKHAFS
jgi:hypothetical protein